MGTIKDAVYQVDNGIDFDEIHFKTKASQVTLQDSSNYFTATDVEGAMKELFINVSNGKSSIATAITDKGVSASEIDTFSVLASKIGQISTGKKWASGSSTSSSSYKVFTLPSSSYSHYYVSINNLAFKPSYIIVFGEGLNYSIYMTDKNYWNYSHVMYSAFVNQNTATCFNFTADNNIIIDDYNYTIPYKNKSTVVQWMAFE